MKKIYQLVISFLILFPLVIYAAAPAWQISSKDSSIKFTATQNGAPTTGEFKSFSGDLAFDPNQLNSSHAKIVVDVASVLTSYAELVDTLKSAEWFNAKAFPQAIYNSSEFTKTGAKTYQSKGTLTIRDKTVPVTLNFIVDEYSPPKMRLHGTTDVKRTAFGVGQGEWSDTKSVKDEVKVDFVLVAVKK